MSDINRELEELIRQLDRRIAHAESATPRDVIDVIIESEPRSTRVSSLRQHPVVQQFHKELVDGLIRADTVNRLLRLITLLLDRLP